MHAPTGDQMIRLGSDVDKYALEDGLSPWKTNQKDYGTVYLSFPERLSWVI